MLKVENISKVFNKDTVNEKKAITNLNLHLNEGDFLTIIGSNGAGKSTLLNCIAGTYQIDDGSIVLDGNDITKLKQFERAKYIARVFQDPLLGTAADMEIQENLSLALHRGEKRNLRYGITNKEKELFKQPVFTKPAFRRQINQQGRFIIGRTKTRLNSTYGDN